MLQGSHFKAQILIEVVEEEYLSCEQNLMTFGNTSQTIMAKYVTFFTKQGNSGR